MAEEGKQNENSARDSALAKEEPDFPIFSEPPILPILSEKRAEVANLRSSLLQEGLVTADGLDSLESVELSNFPCVKNTAHKVYAKYFHLADFLCAHRIDEFPQEEFDKISIKGYLLLLKDMAAELFESALEKLRVEHKNLREKVDGYFKHKLKLRACEHIEERLQLGFWPGPALGPTLMESIEDSAHKLQFGVGVPKSARLSVESLSGTGLPQSGPSETGESSQPQSGPSETGESSQPQSGN